MIILVICLTALAIWLVPDKQPAEVALPPLPSVVTAPPAATAAPETIESDTADPLASVTASAQTTASSLASVASAPVIEEPVLKPASTAAAGMPLTPGGAARRFLADLTTPDPGAALAEAERQQQAGHPLDAYLLTFYAARLGDDQAALMLAHQADPAFGQTDAGPLTVPNIPQALRWYDQAAAAGNPAAIADRQQLRSRIEQAAAEGDEDARRLTLQWQ